jgi:hypothetical protein
MTISLGPMRFLIGASAPMMPSNGKAAAGVRSDGFLTHTW